MAKKYKMVLAKIGKTYRYTYKEPVLEPHDKIMELYNKASSENARRFLGIAANRIYNNDNKKAMQFLSKAYQSVNPASQPDVTKAIAGLMDDLSKATGIPQPRKNYFKI